MMAQFKAWVALKAKTNEEKALTTENNESN